MKKKKYEILKAHSVQRGGEKRRVYTKGQIIDEPDQRELNRILNAKLAKPVKTESSSSRNSAESTN